MSELGSFEILFSLLNDLRRFKLGHTPTALLPERIKDLVGLHMLQLAMAIAWAAPYRLLGWLLGASPSLQAAFNRK